MRANTILGAGVACLALAVAACGGGGGTSSPQASVNAGGPLVSGTATLVIPNAGSASSSSVRKAQFVSPSTVSAGVTVGSGATSYVNVSATSSLCTAGPTSRTCAIPVSAPAGTNIVFAVGLYDQANGGGNLLGMASITQTVALGTPFTVNLKICPIVAAVSNLVVTYSSGTSFTSGAAGTAALTATAADADGNVIPSGTTFFQPVTFTSSDPTVTVAAWTGSATIPVTYSGSPPASNTITLTATAGGKSLATATVAVSSGSSTVSSITCPLIGSSTTTNATLPGNYTVIVETGNYTTSFAPTGGNWIAQSYAVATPTPAPTATPTASPTPSSAPSPSPTPVTVIYWTGTYTVGGYSTTNTVTSAPTTVSATSGCMYAFAVVNGSSPNAGTYGTPQFSIGTSSSLVSSGSVSSFTFTPPLTAGSGPFTGSFTLSNGATGTATIGASQTFTQSDARSLENLLHGRAP